MPRKAQKSAVSPIGERLRLAIAHKRMSLKVFSKTSGVNYRTLQDYLSGSRLPGAEALALIARQGIDVNWLLLGPDDMLKAFKPDSRHPEERPSWLKSTEVAAEVLNLAIEKTEKTAGTLEAKGQTISDDERVRLLARYHTIYVSALQNAHVLGMPEDELVEVARRLRMQLAGGPT